MAHLSQQELAERAGTTQPVVSAVESGSRVPSGKLLSRLMEAAGRRRPSEILRQHREEVIGACARYGVTNLRVFGSVARGDDGYGSDVDLLGALPPKMGLAIVSLTNELEELLGCHVDVIGDGNLDPFFHRSIISDAKPL